MINWEDFQDYIKGRLFLIGLTFVNKQGELIELYQTHGTITDLTDDGLLKIKRVDGTIFQMPYNNETIEKAGKGEYKERATGLIITDPDYIMTWEITLNDNDNTDEIKRVGYVPAV